MPSSSRLPPTASASALARAKAKQASLDAANLADTRRRQTTARLRNHGIGNGSYDGEDDPDRLYYSRNQRDLDSGEDSGDNESDLGDGGELEWGDAVVQDGDDDDGDEAHPRAMSSTSSTYQRPTQSFDVCSPAYVEPGGVNSSASESEEDSAEDLIRFEWQHMLSNVLEGDVLKSEKTRLSTANLSTTTSLANGIGAGFGGAGNSGRRQRAYAIWLLVRAKIRGRTAEEESRYLEEARAKVDEVLTEVVEFKVVDLKQEPGGVPIDDIVVTNNASAQVSSLLKRVDWCESLYPSRKALALEKERVTEGNVVGRLEVLRTWQQITRRIKVTLGILQKWTGSDWEKLSSPTWKDAPAAPGVEGRGFVAGIVREDSLQTTFEKRLLTDLYSLVHTAKVAMLDFSADFAEMNLPGFSADLLKLAIFPSRLAQEALRTVLESVAHVSDPSVILIEKLTADLRKGLEVACEIKRQYIELADGESVSGWNLPERVEDYEETLLATLRFFFKLLHWKLKSPSKAIYFKETEIVENEWVFLSIVTEEIEGGDLLVGEHFSTLTHRLLLRVMSYFETQLQVLETRDMTVTEMLRWFSQTLDNVRARHRKLLRFSRTMLTRFENSAEYTLDNIDLTAFINALVQTGHFIIYTGTFERDGIYMIGDPSLHERPHLVRHILARCFSNDTQIDQPEGEEPMHYILLLSPREAFIWTGMVMNLELPKMEFDLRDRRVRLVSDGPAVRLIRSKQTFVDYFPAFKRNLLIEHKAHLARVSREIKKIGRAIFRLSETIIGAVERVKAVSRRTPGQGQELVGAYFTFAADLGQRSVKYLEPSVRSRYVLMLMKFAISWIAFICDDCVPTDPRTFKWAVAALEFAMSITRGDNILKFSGDEFELLRSKVASCMTLLISHFDILGARSSSEARKEQDRIDAARLEMKRQLEARFAALKGADEGGLPSAEKLAEQDDDDIFRAGWADSSVGSLKQAWEARIAALEELDVSRKEVDAGNRMVGRVLDQEKAEDRSLAFLASSQSNISMRWQQGKFIGGGTFGQVYLAVNLDSGEELAVKEIRFQDLTSAPHLVKTIRDEMKVMEMLRHENIVQYYGIEVHRDKVYIFEEYCSGGSLANLLEHGRIEDEIVVQIYALQMLSGLIYLHSENVVHRDIKPDNILLDSQGTIKFVDFGAAKVLAKNQRTLASRSRVSKPTASLAVDGHGPAEQNSLTGTPMYLSPETVKGERRGKMGAMDVWAVGCVILECATGRRPWSNLDNEWAIMFSIGIAVQHPPLPNEQELSPLGIDFIRQCLDIDPEKRPTAADLMEHPWIVDARNQINELAYDEDVIPSAGSRAGTSSIRTNGSSAGTIALLEEEEGEEEYEAEAEQHDPDAQEEQSLEEAEHEQRQHELDEDDDDNDADFDARAEALFTPSGVEQAQQEWPSGFARHLDRGLGSVQEEEEEP